MATPTSIQVTEPVTDSGLLPFTLDGLELFTTSLDQARVRQQRLTNCPLPAVLAAMAHATPRRLKDMIGERKVDNATRRLLPSSGLKLEPLTGPESTGFLSARLPFDGITRIITVRFQHQAIEISPMLLLDGLKHPRFTFTDSQANASATPAFDRAGWAAYIEKAYVLYRAYGKYENLDWALTPQRVMEDLVREFDWFQITVSDDNRNVGEIWRDAESNLASPSVDQIRSEGWSPTRGTTSVNDRRLGERLLDFMAHAGTHPTIATTSLHTVAVFGVNRRARTVELWNAMSGHGLEEKSIDDFIAEFDGVYRGR